jgi:hypothetical protein
MALWATQKHEIKAFRHDFQRSISMDTLKARVDPISLGSFIANGPKNLN